MIVISSEFLALLNYACVDKQYDSNIILLTAKNMSYFEVGDFRFKLRTERSSLTQYSKDLGATAMGRKIHFFFTKIFVQMHGENIRQPSNKTGCETRSGSHISWTFLSTHKIV